MIRLPDTFAPWAMVVIRLVLGAIFIAHGAQKLFGWFGGGGLEGTAGFLGGMGFRPPMLWAVLLALSEFAGGLLLIIGFLTSIAASGILIGQIVAVALVHWKNGFFAGEGGFEFNLALIAMAAALILAGPGPWSVDAPLKRPGP